MIEQVAVIVPAANEQVHIAACLAARAGRPHRDPHRLASLVRATEHGLVSARLARPQFHWGSLDGMVTEAVSRLMGFDDDHAGSAT